MTLAHIHGVNAGCSLDHEPPMAGAAPNARSMMLDWVGLCVTRQRSVRLTRGSEICSKISVNLAA